MRVSLSRERDVKKLAFLSVCECVRALYGEAGECMKHNGMKATQRRGCACAVRGNEGNESALAAHRQIGRMLHNHQDGGFLREIGKWSFFPRKFFAEISFKILSNFSEISKFFDWNSKFYRNLLRMTSHCVTSLIPLASIWLCSGFSLDKLDCGYAFSKFFSVYRCIGAQELSSFFMSIKALKCILKLSIPPNFSLKREVRLYH